MRSDDDEYEALADEFVELREVSANISKEVYAHFGLTFYAFGLVEHGLMNAIHVNRLYALFKSDKIRSAVEWEAAWDKVEAKLHKMTFGAFVSEASAIPEFHDLGAELRNASDTRNYFAHKLFREAAELFVLEAGAKLLLVRIAKTRRAMEGLDAQVGKRLRQMLVRMRLPQLDVQRLDAMSQAAVDRAEAAIRAGGVQFGWKP